MAKVTICGDAVVITSEIKLEDIKFIQKYRKDALTLMGGEDDKEPLFSICAGNCGTGSINKYGATFTSETRDDAKLATLTLISDVESDEDIKSVIADEIGGALTNLNKLESQLPEVLGQVRAERQAVMDAINVAQ